MDLERKIKIISEIALFEDCSQEEIIHIATDTSHKFFRKNQLTIESAAARHRVYLIASRSRMKVSVSNPINSEELIVYMLSYGDLFNVMTLIDDKEDYLVAHAIDDIDILYCGIEKAREWVRQFPNFNLNLLKYLTMRLRQVQSYSVQHTFYSIEVRLALLIYHNIHQVGQDVNLLSNLSHNEIAKMLGTTRAVVNRNLQKLKKDGLVDINRKRILVHDYERLRSLIEKYEII